MTQAPSVAPVQGTPAPVQTTPPAARTVCGIEGVGNPAAVYRALNARGNELESQRSTLVTRRDAWARRAREGPVGGSADDVGIQTRIKDIDAQLAAVDAQIAANNASVACMAGVPGAVLPPPQRGPSNDDLAIAGLFLSSMLALPLVIAWSRRIWRRGVQTVPYMPPELNERLMRIEQSVESVAIEVERVGEGQRFVTNLFAQNGSRAIGAGAMEPADVQQRERVAQERRDR